MIVIARNGMGARLSAKTLALGLCASMVAPGLLAGCGGQAAAPPPNAMQPRMQQPNRMQQPSQGMSGKQKMLLLGGAALAYYLYKKNRNAQNQALPQGVQMYRSKNGGIYYRDPRNPQTPIYVVPPTGQPFNTRLQVSESEVQGLNLQQYQGYGGGSSGTGLDAVRQLIPAQ